MTRPCPEAAKVSRFLQDHPPPGTVAKFMRVQSPPLEGESSRPFLVCPWSQCIVELKFAVPFN